jgi:hypothetical protein
VSNGSSNQDGSIRTLALRWLALSSWAVWFGGLAFYIAFVVPLGAEVLGSDLDQGFITRKVTVRLNVIGAIGLILFAPVTFVRSKGEPVEPAWIVGVSLWLLLLASLTALVIVHPMMDRLLDPEERAVLDHGRFYTLHRIYLWTSTIHFFALPALAACWLVRWRRADLTCGRRDAGL